MKTILKSSKLLKNNRQSNNKQSIKTRKNKRGGRRTMKGGATTFINPSNQIKINEWLKSQSSSSITPLSENSRKQIMAILKQIQLDKQFKNLKFENLIQKAPKAQNAHQKEELQKIVKQFVEAGTIELINKVDNEADNDTILVNSLLNDTERFNFAANSFESFRLYGCPHTSLKFSEDTTDLLINKISNFSHCFDGVETLDLSETKIKKLPVNFSNIMSLKYLILPSTIESNNFYQFAVKIPSLRYIEVPNFYKETSIGKKIDGEYITFKKKKTSEVPANEEVTANEKKLTEEIEDFDTKLVEIKTLGTEDSIDFSIFKDVPQILFEVREPVRTGSSSVSVEDGKAIVSSQAVEEGTSVPVESDEDKKFTSILNKLIEDNKVKKGVLLIPVCLNPSLIINLGEETVGLNELNEGNQVNEGSEVIEGN